MIKRLFLLLCCCLPLLSLACIPSRNEAFSSVATHAPDAVVGHFISLNAPAHAFGFTVTSSLRKTVKPGNYRLMISGPYGPPSDTGMPCPAWTTVALASLPNGANTNQHRWVLLFYKAEGDTLYLTMDERYAAQWTKDDLAQQDAYDRKTSRVNAQQFIRWFKKRPRSGDEAGWRNTAPVWHTIAGSKP